MKLKNKAQGLILVPFLIAVSGCGGSSGSDTGSLRVAPTLIERPLGAARISQEEFDSITAKPVFSSLSRGMYLIQKANNDSTIAGVTCTTSGIEKEVVLKVDDQFVYLYKDSSESGNKLSSKEKNQYTCIPASTHSHEVVRMQLSKFFKFSFGDSQAKSIEFYTLNHNLYIYLDQSKEQMSSQAIMMIEKYETTPAFLGLSFVKAAVKQEGDGTAENWPVSGTFSVNMNSTKDSSGTQYDLSSLLPELKSIRYCDETQNPNEIRSCKEAQDMSALIR